jgi:hypothetical protein
LDPLVSASRGFSTAIQQQILAIQRGPSLIEFVAKTIVYADAKVTYFNALREVAPELMNIATGREVRPPELDHLRGGVRGRRRKHLLQLQRGVFEPSVRGAEAHQGSPWLECFFSSWQSTEKIILF